MFGISPNLFEEETPPAASASGSLLIVDGPDTNSVVSDQIMPAGTDGFAVSGFGLLHWVYLRLILTLARCHHNNVCN